MNDERSLVRWIESLRAGDEDAATELWRRYFDRLVALASKKMPRVRRDYDEEDVALSAFKSLCRGVQGDRFPDLRDEGNLWSLLVVLTARKVSQHRRRAEAEKRGGGRVRGESVFGDAESTVGGLGAVVGEEPTPEFAVGVAEESERLLDRLATEELRAVALRKLEGYSHEEIAAQLDCAVRSVERRVRLIRRVWSEDE